jgi:two-component system phosphate regulon response regulator PhoB
MLRKILVIEDVPAMLQLIAMRLKVLGYLVETAKSGDEGLKKIQSGHPDLLITDMALPGKLSGSMLIRHLRLDEKTKKMPIIVLSAFVRKGMEKGLEHPADVYIPKPFDSEELAAAIRSLLGDSSGGSERTDVFVP